MNTLGEVPDSSWFTNRMSRRVMTIEELVRGPNQLDGPDRSEPWVIIDLKTEGITPGLLSAMGRTRCISSSSILPSTPSWPPRRK